MPRSAASGRSSWRLPFLLVFYVCLLLDVVHAQYGNDTEETTTRAPPVNTVNSTLNPYKGRPASKIYSHYSQSPVLADTGFLKVVASYTSGSPSISTIETLNGVLRVQHFANTRSIVVHTDNLADQEAVVVALGRDKLGDILRNSHTSHSPLQTGRDNQ